MQRRGADTQFLPQHNQYEGAPMYGFKRELPGVSTPRHELDDELGPQRELPGESTVRRELE